MSPEINPDSVYRGFRRDKPSFAFIYTFCKDYPIKPVAGGIVYLHNVKGEYLVPCCNRLTKHTGASCVMCGMGIPKEPTPFEVYYDTQSFMLCLNRTEKGNRTGKYCEISNILAIYSNKQYKNPHNPSIFNALDLYPSYTMLRLNDYYDRTLKYSNDRIKQFMCIITSRGDKNDK